ncbi:MAG TPA: XRE family transcriptional regulator [Steroidobacteraceae bacterium]|nr:XRE family transcriptional regulator [Steroidobacteraceae bacterium]
MKTRHPTLGSLLRSLRARNGWTLKEMSEHTDIPVSTLSKVEHDRLTLTYDKLVQLSQRLNIRISELFADPADSVEPAVTARRSIGVIEDAVRVNTKNYDYYYLCPELRKKRMIPILTRIRAKSAQEFGELVRHSGEEYIYVLKGGINVLTEFYDPVSLGVGESIYLDSNMGHAYVTAEGCEEATVLGMCSSTDESLLDSLMSLHGEVNPSTPPKSAEPPRPHAKAAKIRKRST